MQYYATLGNGNTKNGNKRKRRVAPCIFNLFWLDFSGGLVRTSGVAEKSGMTCSLALPLPMMNTPPIPTGLSPYSLASAVLHRALYICIFILVCNTIQSVSALHLALNFAYYYFLLHSSFRPEGFCITRVSSVHFKH